MLNTAASGSNPDNQTFEYDDLSRLKSAEATGGAANYTKVTYTYSEIGNIGTFEGKTYDYNNVSWNGNCTAPTQEMPHAVRKIGASDYFCYDGNGNMTKRVEGGVTYDQQFDVENRLVSVTVGSATTTFAYDASGQRVKTVEPGGKTTYFPFGNYEETVVGSSTIKRSSYALAGQVVAFRVAGDPVSTNNGLFFVYGDHLGSTSVLQKSGEAQHLAGSLTRYRPFGSYRTAPTQTITDRDFTGQRENRELGLLYYNARFYHPASGRFISPDSLVPNPSDPQSFNRYTYVRNSPVNRVDPTGHVDCALLGDASDMQGCGKAYKTPPREIQASVPDLIQNATPFNTLPFDPSAYTGGSVQGFGDTEFASNKDNYSAFGYLHPGVDIPMNTGTALLALGDGEVVCGGQDTYCGQQSTSGGHGISILYEACNCIVNYVHANNVLEEGTKVTAGMVVGVSGASSDGYQHLHLEIRDTGSPQTVYNPVYFFHPETWNSMNLTYMGYQNNYANPETRMYSIQIMNGNDYWNGPPYPLVFVR